LQHLGVTRHGVMAALCFCCVFIGRPLRTSPDALN
jgi:hypothetical protein